MLQHSHYRIPNDLEKSQSQRTQEIETSKQKLGLRCVKTQSKNRNFKRKQGSMIPLKVNTSTTNDLNHNEEERS
jgi:hypothetical protein